MKFRAKVEASVVSGRISASLARALPTVENPQHKLFAKLLIADDAGLLVKILGRDLQTVQTTKGCPNHQCTHCHVDAPKKLEVMPFAAVYRIAQIVRIINHVTLEAYEHWRNQLDERGIIQKDNELVAFGDGDDNEEPWLEGDELWDLGRIALTEWKEFSGAELFRLVPPYPSGISKSYLQRNFLELVPLSLYYLRNSILNYVDSDPLDYVDRTFLHEDGTPADYGDVFRLLADEVRPVHVTTAGWQLSNRIAERAVKKIVETWQEHRAKLFDFRLSVSPFEKHARQNWSAYLENVKRMIEVVAPIEPVVIVYYDEEVEGQKKLARNTVAKLKRYCQRKGFEKVKIDSFPISHFSGRAGNDQEDYDPFDKGGGYFILPSGEVLFKPIVDWQACKWENGQPVDWYYASPKGSMPEPTGIWLYKLRDT